MLFWTLLNLNESTGTGLNGEKSGSPHKLKALHKDDRTMPASAFRLALGLSTCRALAGFGTTSTD
jgi:hypothetical protein